MNQKENECNFCKCELIEGFCPFCNFENINYDLNGNDKEAYLSQY